MHYNTLSTHVKGYIDTWDSLKSMGDFLLPLTDVRGLHRFKTLLLLSAGRLIQTTHIKHCREQIHTSMWPLVIVGEGPLHTEMKWKMYILKLYSWIRAILNEPLWNCSLTVNLRYKPKYHWEMCGPCRLSLHRRVFFLFIFLQSTVSAWHHILIHFIKQSSTETSGPGVSDISGARRMVSAFFLCGGRKERAGPSLRKAATQQPKVLQSQFYLKLHLDKSRLRQKVKDFNLTETLRCRWLKKKHNCILTPDMSTPLCATWETRLDR